MLKIVLSVLLFIFGITGYSQGGNCLYIDASNGQLFYIKLNNKIHSSSLGGYVIITGIQEARTELSIGFAGNQFPEQRFLLSMNSSDQGFHLQNTLENGWELQNLKTLAAVQNSNPKKAAGDPDQIRKTDAFSLMLSKVVNDSAVLFAGSKLKVAPAVVVPARDFAARMKEDVATSSVNVPEKAAIDPTVATVEIIDSSSARPLSTDSIAVKEVAKAADSVVAVKELQKAPDTIRAQKDLPKAKDSVIALKDTAMQVTVTQITAEELNKEDHPDIIMIPAPVRKIFDQYFEKVYEATYVDKNKGKYDTIRLSYPINIDTPAQKPAATVPAAGTIITEKATTTDTALKTTMPVTHKTEDTIVTTTESADTKPVEATAVVCKMSANEQDADNLRVKILEATSADEKLATARVFFISKCYSVKQIKGLSELFKGDEAKYRFFDAAHLYITDSTNFPTLVSELKEDYYRNRFKAITRK